MEITKWEYKKAGFSEKTLTELGKEGWEAFAVDDVGTILKRPCGKIQVREVPHKEEK